MSDPRYALIVGDSGNRGKKFFDAIWGKVFRECCAAAELETIEGITDNLQESNAFLEVHSASFPNLLPRAFAASAYRARDFERILEAELSKVDVGAVISAAPSSATDVLIRLLAPSGIPLLLTVDSTTLLYRQTKLSPFRVDFARHRPLVLQLVADNSQQASAIYGTLLALPRRRGTREKVILWTPNEHQAYVDDLCRELRDLASTPTVDLSLDTVVHLQDVTVDDIFAVVYVGYSTGELNRALGEHKIPFLIADGVPKSECTAWTDRSKWEAVTLFFEPTVRFDECAWHAYEACNDALIATDGRTFGEAVRNQLLVRGYRFTSEGANAAAGYVPIGHGATF